MHFPSLCFSRHYRWAGSFRTPKAPFTAGHLQASPGSGICCGVRGAPAAPLLARRFTGVSPGVNLVSTQPQALWSLKVTSRVLLTPAAWQLVTEQWRQQLYLFCTFEAGAKPTVSYNCDYCMLQLLRSAIFQSSHVSWETVPAICLISSTHGQQISASCLSQCSWCFVLKLKCVFFLLNLSFPTSQENI